MTVIRVYDPAMCCETGVCGPVVDPELTRVANALFLLEQKSIDVKRYNLGNEPQAFVDETLIQKLLEEKGVDALPAVIVNGTVVKTGEYPTNKELAEWTGVREDELQPEKKEKDDLTLF
ncbi:arsenite efflux transporter metallochaperone ArsD [Alteribacter keqinensis]|uniref:Arsenical resistance operon transcriptional repressor ArsD n=1 Tax=Alteribacter keqinensis TaxID=2483800 RepID=A0A3M7TV52_9BACI|nr:arsenite efflux transporter metallochaperone ArsD [Alteribacter keqinensis]RNA68614.1 arsenical resistance operon transcriptional repressor ArsD [Alteribacter keqinensis]